MKITKKTTRENNFCDICQALRKKGFFLHTKEDKLFMCITCFVTILNFYNGIKKEAQNANRKRDVKNSEKNKTPVKKRRQTRTNNRGS